MKRVRRMVIDIPTEFDDELQELCQRVGWSWEGSTALLMIKMGVPAVLKLLEEQDKKKEEKKDEPHKD